jgi:CelD/BcsL family acetyltransferase involved in cellulose biosynthesis
MTERKNREQGEVFQVLDAANAKERARWLEVWSSWPRGDVFAHPEYVRLYESEHERACAAVYKTATGSVLYPFLRRSLEALDWVPKELASYSDMTSPYGYGGAYYWGEDDDRTEVSDRFWMEYNKWAERERCIAEFIRFHLFEQDLAVYPFKKVLRTKNIVRSLTLSEDSLWMDFKHKVRKNVKKAQRSGLECIIDEDGQYLADFLNVYESTMGRRDAPDFYYFNRQYFQAVFDYLPANSAYFFVLDGSKIVSTELVLYSSETAYSFLGGTLEASFDKRPNDLLKFEVMTWARDRGISNYVLGGGYTPEDGIYRYKRSFAPDGEYNFYTGQRMMNVRAYEELVISRMDNSNGTWQSRHGYFPQYRS